MSAIERNTAIERDILSAIGEMRRKKSGLVNRIKQMWVVHKFMSRNESYSNGRRGRPYTHPCPYTYHVTYVEK